MAVPVLTLEAAYRGLAFLTSYKPGHVSDKNLLFYSIRQKALVPMAHTRNIGNEYPDQKDASDARAANHNAAVAN